MAKKSVRRVSRKPIFIILGLSLVLAIGFAFWKSTRPEPIQIMAIDPIPITYGDTTLSGGLHQDDLGNFILVLPDRRVVTLDVKGIDQLIGLPVTVTGNLPVPTADSISLSMTVNSITITQE